MFARIRPDVRKALQVQASMNQDGGEVSRQLRWDDSDFTWFAQRRREDFELKTATPQRPRTSC